METIPEKAKSRFFPKVEVRGTDECWPWKAGRFIRGYGAFSFQGTCHNASRVAYAIAHGAFDDSLLVRHTCDNPPCCNPAHLVLGTTQDNMTDKKLKRRCNPAVGERGGSAKLTNEKVIEIRRLYATGALLQRQIAAMFGVGQKAICKIVNRKRWSHI